MSSGNIIKKQILPSSEREFNKIKRRVTKARNNQIRSIKKATNSSNFNVESQ